MKALKTITILFFLLFFISLQAQTPMKFFHPGGVVGQTELDFVKAKIAARQQPWYGFYNQMKAGAKSGSNAKKQVSKIIIN